MALTLTAEQKSIFEIFSGKNQYTIPPYQRPYSWDVKHCVELLDDFKKAYSENKKEGYFLGNIVIAKSFEEKIKLEVIDGQQRLTTLTLLIRVLLEFDESNDDLKNAITIPGNRRGAEKVQRLKTNVFMEKDYKFVEEVLDENFDFNNNCQIKKNDNRFKKNICYLYNEIEKFSKDNNIQNFIDFIMYDVSILPIYTEAPNPNKAREKALKIFETINNRGLNLSTSDIFKAKLFSKALNESKHEDFIKKWNELDKKCDNIDFSINFIFYIYMYLIRGKNEIYGNELHIRDFFINDDHSPFIDTNYADIMDVLFRIVNSIKFFKEVKINQAQYGELTKWFQVLDEICKNTAMHLTVLYLTIYHLNLENKQQIILKSKELIKYFLSDQWNGVGDLDYSLDFDFIDTIKDIINNEKLRSYTKELETSARMYDNALTLLDFYLDSEQKSIYPYYLTDIRDIITILSFDYLSFNPRIISKYNTAFTRRRVGEMQESRISFAEKIKLYEKSNTVKKDLINLLKEFEKNKNKEAVEFFWKKRRGNIIKKIKNFINED